MNASRPARLLFDANVLGKPTVADLARLLTQHRAQSDELAEVVHVFDFQTNLRLGEEGVWDEMWIPQAAERGWTIVAADRGKGGLSKGRKLPNLCLEHGATHILLSSVIHHRRQFSKFFTMLSVWHEFVEIASAAPGARYMLEPSGPQTSHRGRGKLSRRNTATPSPTPPPLKAFRPDAETDQGEDKSA